MIGSGDFWAKNHAKDLPNRSCFLRATPVIGLSRLFEFIVLAGTLQTDPFQWQVKVNRIYAKLKGLAKEFGMVHSLKVTVRSNPVFWPYGFRVLGVNVLRDDIMYNSMPIHPIHPQLCRIIIWHKGP